MRRFVALPLVLGLVLLAVSPAGADHVPGTLSKNKDSVPQGGKIQFTATNCKSGEGFRAFVVFRVFKVTPDRKKPDILVAIEKVFTDQKGTAKYVHPVAEGAKTGKYRVAAECKHKFTGGGMGLFYRYHGFAFAVTKG